MSIFLWIATCSKADPRNVWHPNDPLPISARECLLYAWLSDNSSKGKSSPPSLTFIHIINSDSSYIGLVQPECAPPYVHISRDTRRWLNLGSLACRQNAFQGWPLYPQSYVRRRRQALLRQWDCFNSIWWLDRSLPLGHLSTGSPRRCLYCILWWWGMPIIYISDIYVYITHLYRDLQALTTHKNVCLRHGYFRVTYLISRPLGGFLSGPAQVLRSHFMQRGQLYLIHV